MDPIKSPNASIPMCDNLISLDGSYKKPHCLNPHLKPGVLYKDPMSISSYMKTRVTQTDPSFL